MRDPYTVLGVKPSVSDEDLKKAYRALVKKYHPDRYANSPLEHEAQEKLKDINLAYDEIQKIRRGESTGPSGYGGSGYGAGGFGGGYGYTRSNTGGQSNGGWDFNSAEGSARFSDIRQMISTGLIAQAEAALDRMNERPAEWYYLRGIVYLRRGQYAQAQQHFDAAAQMDPGNASYQAAAQRMRASYQQAWNRHANVNSMNINPACRVLATIMCLSSCCGGNAFCPVAFCC